MAAVVPEVDGLAELAIPLGESADGFKRGVVADARVQEVDDHVVRIVLGGGAGRLAGGEGTRPPGARGPRRAFGEKKEAKRVVEPKNRGPSTV